MKRQAPIAPGPPGSKVLGNLQEFRRDVLGLLTNSAREFGDVVRFRLGPHVVHLLNHPDHIEHVLQKNPQNYDRGTRSASKIRAVCGESLLTTDGEFWRQQRRLIQPAFHHQRIAGFASVMADETASMLERWQPFAASGTPLNVASEMSRLAYSIVGKTLFSADVTTDAEEVERALAVVLEHTYHRLETLLDLPVSFPLPANRLFQTALRAIDKVVYRIIAERRQQPGEHADLLSMLLPARDDTGEAMSDSQLRNEVIALLLAGFETTANALSWTFYLLSQNPETERQLRAEAATVEDISKLKYTTMVFHEALRLYPPIWILERRVVTEEAIGGYRIPAGSTVVVSPFVLHRHPAFWGSPERFDPLRFADASIASRPPGAFLPFGAGPHQCIGNNFAMMEARIILSMVLKKFSLQTVPGHPVEPKPGITLRPRHGLMMIAHSQNPPSEHAK